MYFMYISCKTLSIQYMWKYVNSKCICVISLFISYVLSLNWWADSVVKDCQHPPQLLPCLSPYFVYYNKVKAT